ncbi:hypothetical protein Bbelb_170420 [Branchiostoma belcheri]|nr:hypothetical protein Bbelb_170420 [Branchiostoma belcheri]
MKELAVTNVRGDLRVTQVLASLPEVSSIGNQRWGMTDRVCTRQTVTNLGQKLAAPIRLRNAVRFQGQAEKPPGHAQMEEFSLGILSAEAAWGKQAIASGSFGRDVAQLKLHLLTAQATNVDPLSTLQ